MENRVISATITNHMVIVADCNEIRGIKLPNNVPFFSHKAGSGLNSRGLFAANIPLGKDDALCVAAPDDVVGKIKVQWYDGTSKKYSKMQFHLQACEDGKV